MIVIIISLTIFIIVAIEVPSIIKKGTINDLVVFCVLIIIGGFYSITQVLGMKLLNPTDLIVIIWLGRQK